jgi:tetratricopeptide (TPR) repeat protein
MSSDPLLDRARRAAELVASGDVTQASQVLDCDWTVAAPDIAGLAGALLFAVGQFDDALPALQRAAGSPTTDPGAHLVNLGRTLAYLGRTEEALPVLRRGVELSIHDTALARQSLAEALVAQGSFEEALAVLPKDDADEAMIAARTAVLAMSGRHEDAARELATALATKPDSQSLLLLSAQLAQVRGRDGEAARLIRKALEQDEDNITLWVRLAQIGRAGQTSSFAREAADKAMELANGKEPHEQAMALVAHAHVLGESGAQAEAEAAYNAALELAPGLLPALSGLGHILIQTGAVEEAIACFEQVKAASPLQGWSQLIHAHKVPDDPKVLESLERAARLPSLEGPLRASLLLTVAAAFDRNKDHDRAMRLAGEANEAAKAMLPYSPADHRRRVEREMACFSRAFMDSRAGWGDPSRLPVFVLGMPRSGTTLTEQILGSHSKVCGAGELGLIPQQIGKMEAWQMKLGSGWSYPECVADMTAEISRTFAAQLLEKLQEHDPAASHVIDKLPHNFEHIGLIKLLFPNAVIFHCRREARDIAVSNYLTDYAAKFGGMGFSYDLGWIGEQLVDHDRLMNHWHGVFPGQIMEVIYEELVEDTEGWARRMIAFLGLNWEPGVLEPEKLDRPVKTASVWQVRQPVYTTSKARWKRYEAHLGGLEEALAQVPPPPPALAVPDMPPGLFTQGLALLQQGQAQEAETCFLQVLAMHKDHAAAHHFLGGALLQQGKAQEAARSMRHSVRLLPIHASWFENLARAEHLAQSPEAAKAAWLKAQDLRGTAA